MSQTPPVAPDFDTPQSSSVQAPTGLTNRASVEELAAARDHARRYRAQWLVAVSEGRASVDDVIRAATAKEGKPLLAITIEQLLLARPGHGKASADRVFRKVDAVLELPKSNVTKVTSRRWTIASLLDSRVGGRRYIAFSTTLLEGERLGDGFPFTPLIKGRQAARSNDQKDRVR